MIPETVTNRSEAYRHFRDQGYSIGLASRMATDWTIESLWHRAKDAEAALKEMRTKAGRVCRTAGIICESALANQANPETPDADSTTFDLLASAVGATEELRAILAATPPVKGE